VEVAMENSENLVEYITNLVETLNRFKDIIGRRDSESLSSLLEEISAFRRRLDAK
jgi:prephenate dehydrogenase